MRTSILLLFAAILAITFVSVRAEESQVAEAPKEEQVQTKGWFDWFDRDDDDDDDDDDKKKWRRGRRYDQDDDDDDDYDDDDDRRCRNYCMRYNSRREGSRYSYDNYDRRRYSRPYNYRRYRWYKDDDDDDDDDD